MARRIFVNYRRDDAKADARSLRDRLASAFGDANVFMDIDNLLPGHRFDLELEKALEQCDVFLAVIGRRWEELLAARQESGGDDYVRKEIAAALGRGIVVIPVLFDGAPLPRSESLPEDIRALVMHQKHEVAHERFGRDVSDLVAAIKAARAKPAAISARFTRQRGLVAAGLGAAALAGAFAWQSAQLPGTNLLVFPATTASVDSLPTTSPERSQGATACIEVVVGTEQRCLAPAESFKDCPTCPAMVPVPVGGFMMGSPDSEPGRASDEGPQRKVALANAFAAGKSEVTRGEYEAFVTETGERSRDGCAVPTGDAWAVLTERSWRDPGFAQDADHPVVCVNWEDAQAYADWLSAKTGHTYRLLSEAEWEYAARAGSTSPFSWGTTMDHDQANYDATTSYGGGAKGSARRGTVAAASFVANPFGLHGFHGNVWEWVADCWHATLNATPTDGSPSTKGDCTKRVRRGGSWYSLASDLRAASRVGYDALDRASSTGFRVARSLLPAAAPKLSQQSGASKP